MTKTEIQAKTDLLEEKVTFYGEMLIQKDDLVNGLINEINKAYREGRQATINNVIDTEL